MDKWFILKNQNWILPTCDSFPLIVSQLPKISSFMKKKTVISWSFIIKKYQITYKIIVCGEKNGQKWYYIIQKIIERFILAIHVQCLLQKRTSLCVAGAFMPFNKRVTSCQYELAVIFFCVVCVSTLPWVIDMSYRSVNIPAINTFDNR